MSLTTQAAQMYKYARELEILNKKLTKLGKHVEKHKTKYHKSTDDKKRKRHKAKHAYYSKHVHELLKKHNQLLLNLKEHHKLFEHKLKRQQKL